jgi:hypothetical protein
VEQVVEQVEQEVLEQHQAIQLFQVLNIKVELVG